MNRPAGSRLEKVLADFAEQYGVLDRAREQMRALSVTACSKDGAVEVTVGADGRASGIRFVGRRFREMAAPQLGDSVMEALMTARAEVAARATAVLLSANARLPTAVEGIRGIEPLDGTRSRPQEPLWGRPGARSSSPHASVPVELREAIVALRDAVRDAV